MKQEWLFSNKSCGVSHEGDQLWLFDDKAMVTGVRVIADGKSLVEFGTQLEDLEVLGAHVSPQNGTPIPGTFVNCPYSGVPSRHMLQPHESQCAPDWDGDGLPMCKLGTEEVKLGPTPQQHRLPSGNVLCVVAGTPAALYALDYSSEELLYRYSPSRMNWLTDHPDHVPAIRASGRKMWMDAVVATPEGIAYTGVEGPVWVNLPILREARTSILKGYRCVGAPGLFQTTRGRVARGTQGNKGIFMPVVKDDTLFMACKIPETKDWKTFPANVEGALPSGLEFAPPVVAISATFWISADGLLTLPLGSSEAVFRAWPEGIKGIPQSRPFVDRAGSMWALGQSVNNKAVLVQLKSTGFGEVQYLDSPYFSAGDRCYRGRHLHELSSRGRPLDPVGPEIQPLMGFDDSFFLPIQTFHPRSQPTDGRPEISITLGALVNKAGQRSNFLEGSHDTEHQVRLMMHTPGNPAIDLEKVFTVMSVASLATYRYHDRLHVHSRESDTCYSWPVISS